MQALAVHADIQHADDIFDDFTKCQCDNCEVVTLEAQYRHTDDDTGNGGTQATDDHSNCQTQRGEGNGFGKAGGGDDARKGTDRHKAGMTERQFTQDTDGQVERNGHNNIGADRDKLAFERRGDIAGQNQNLHENKGNDDDAERNHAVALVCQ